MAMLMSAGINPEVSCSAATPADIQWMIRAGYGLALVDRTAFLDAGLTTRPITGTEWTSDTAFVHHKKADHLALPFAIQFLQQMRRAERQAGWIKEGGSPTSTASSGIVSDFHRQKLSHDS